MNRQLKEYIKTAIKGRVLFEEPMAPHTSFRIGGPAEVWVEPADINSLAEIIRFSRKEGIPLMVIGAGSNVLVGDKGIRGIVVSLSSVHFRTIDITGEQRIRVSSGVRLQKLLRITRNREWGGLEFTAGIPGTLGGAIIMNVGGKDRYIGDLVSKVDLMDKNGGLTSLARKDIGFGYRFSGLEDYVVLGAHLHLKNRPRDLIDRDISDYLRFKKTFQELELPSAGCIFKNPKHSIFPGRASDLPRGARLAAKPREAEGSRGKPREAEGRQACLPDRQAGQLIELSGLKGRRVGAAEVSAKHANFIVNRGKARAKDVIKLIELVRKKVKKDHNLDLELELKVIG